MDANAGQLIGLAINFIAWTVTYVLIVVRSFKDKRAGIPLEAISLMLAFELAYVFFFGIETADPTLTAIFLGIEIAWLVLDVILFVQVMLWGDLEQDSPDLTQHHWLVCLAWIVLGLFGVITFIAMFDLDNAGIFAFMDEAIIAMLMVPYVLKRQSLDGISYAALWSRTVADIGATVALLVFSPWCNIFLEDSTGRCVIGVQFASNLFVVFLACAWFLSDVIVLVVGTRWLVNGPPPQAQAPGTSPPP